MESAVNLLTIVCYGLTLYLWWLRRTPVFTFTLVAGHLAALLSPLWSFFYGGSYAPELTILFEIAGATIYKPVFIASSWFYSLPVLIIFYLYGSHWWFSGYITGLITFITFFFYHLLIEIVGIRLDIWSYAAAPDLPLGIGHALLTVIMAALISLGQLYVVLLFHRYAWVSMFIAILPSTLLLSLLVRGLLGSPLWISLLLKAESWAADIGMICTLGLLGWGLHIIVWGLARVDKEILV